MTVIIVNRDVTTHLSLYILVKKVFKFIISIMFITKGDCCIMHKRAHFLLKQGSVSKLLTQLGCSWLSSRKMNHIFQRRVKNDQNSFQTNKQTKKQQQKSWKEICEQTRKKKKKILQIARSFLGKKWQTHCRENVVSLTFMKLGL